MVNIKNNLTKIIAVFAIIFMVIFAGCTRGEPRDNDVVACTMDAKMCPDGSYVGRTGKNCEFVCPIGNSSTADLKKFNGSPNKFREIFADYLSALTHDPFLPIGLAPKEGYGRESAFREVRNTANKFKLKIC